MNVEEALNKAVFGRLSLGSYKVNDGWFEADKLPLITIGEIVVEPGQMKVNEDWFLMFTIHTWSNKSSSLEVKQMNHFARECLEEAQVPGYRVSSRLVRTLTLKEKQSDNSLIYHGVTQYRYRVYKEEINHG